MNELTNRRSMTFLIFGLLFLWMVTPLFFPRIPFFPRGGVKTAYAMPSFPSLSFLSRSADSVVTIRKSQNLNGLSLNSHVREYTVLFTGRVTCGDAPCSSVSVRLQLETAHNETIEKKVVVAEDGSFHLDVLFKEMPQEHMDFVLIAVNAQSQSADARVRRILTDEAQVTIDTSLVLN